MSISLRNSVFTFAVLFASTASAAADAITVFKAGDDGYACYRIPAIVAAMDGSLLAFCEGRINGCNDAGNIDIVLKQSNDGGNTWSKLRLVVDDGANACSNPAPIVDRKTGRIVLLHTRTRDGTREHQILRGDAPPCSVWVTHSDDHGHTWSTPVEISGQVRKPGWRWFATGPCHGVQLRDGTLAMPCNYSTSPDTADWHSFVILSKDGGATWSAGGIADGHTNESTLCELSDGRLYLNMRNYRETNRRAVVTSNDGGTTWSPVRDDPALIEPVCQASVLRLSNGTLLFSNPASTERERLTIRASEDGGTTWREIVVLHEGPAAYSDLVEFGDGHVGCLYERGNESVYETIVFEALPMPK